MLCKNKENPPADKCPFYSCTGRQCLALKNHFLRKKVFLVAPTFQTERLTSQNGHVCVFSVLFLFWSFLILQMSCFNIFCLASILSIRTSWSTTSSSFLVTANSSLSSLCLIHMCSLSQFSRNWPLNSRNQIPNKIWSFNT